VKAFSLAHRSNYLICPLCEAGELHPFGKDHARCDSCGCILSAGIVLTLEQIIALPDALGRHACDCGHPEMRRLPEGALHCPACGSEVLPIEATSGSSYRSLT
jgi:ribosomal protein L37AE/L43A